MNFILLDLCSTEKVRNSQFQDDDICPLVTALETGSGRPRRDQVSSGRAALKTLWRQWDKLKIQNDLLYCLFYDTDLEEDYSRLVVPTSARTDLLHHFHDILTAGHLGSDKMIYRLKRRFYWPDMKDDIVQYCTSCDICVAKSSIR